MQPDRLWQDQTHSRFMQASRLYLGLMKPALAIKPPRRVAGRSRQILRSLLVAGSLGTLFGGPAFASEASYQVESGKRAPNAHSTRAKAVELPGHAHRLSPYNKHR